LQLADLIIDLGVMSHEKFQEMVSFFPSLFIYMLLALVPAFCHFSWVSVDIL